MSIIDAVEECTRDMLAREAARGLRPNWQAEYAPRVLPPGWALEHPVEPGQVGVYRCHSLAAMWSANLESDERRWIHVSLSHAARLPRWEELREAKDVLIGRDRYAYQVMPPVAKYVNFHPHVLHLWSCLDGDPLPDFTRGLGII